MVKPLTYTHQPGEIVVKKGGNTLNYNYTPSVNAKSSTGTIAYEYCFSNPMTRSTAVNLKEIDTTDVNVSYAWSLNTKIDVENSTFTSKTNFECQKLPNQNDQIYLYIIVSPTNTNIPVTFTSSIVWYYGIPTEVHTYSSIDGTMTSTTIVSGQEIKQEVINQPEVPENYVLEGWYYDSNYTTPVTFPIRSYGKALYAKIEYDRSPLYTQNGTIDSEGYTLYGAYPQDYVGSTLNTTLKTQLSNGTLTSTGWTYTTDIDNTTTTLTEYEYNGAYYAYLSSSKVYSTSYTFNTDTSITIGTGNAYFFKVEPLRWTNHNGTYLCEKIIGSRRFAASGVSLWENSEVRTWLNEVFYIESGISLIKKNTTTIPNNTTAGEKASYPGTATEDYMWLPSYQECNTWFSDNISRQNNCSDLAKATYTRWNISYSSCHYWTRSAYSASDVYYVGANGYFSPGTSTYTYPSVRPAFAL